MDDYLSFVSDEGICSWATDVTIFDKSHTSVITFPPKFDHNGIHFKDVTQDSGNMDINSLKNKEGWESFKSSIHSKDRIFNDWLYIDTTKDN